MRGVYELWRCGQKATKELRWGELKLEMKENETLRKDYEGRKNWRNVDDKIKKVKRLLEKK